MLMFSKKKQVSHWEYCIFKKIQCIQMEGELLNMITPFILQNNEITIVLWDFYIHIMNCKTLKSDIMFLFCPTLVLLYHSRFLHKQIQRDLWVIVFLCCIARYDFLHIFCVAILDRCPVLREGKFRNTYNQRNCFFIFNLTYFRYLKGTGGWKCQIEVVAQAPIMIFTPKFVMSWNLFRITPK